jgi:hypothetical protein
MKDEWDRALHRLEQHKLKKKRDAELAMEQAKEDDKQKQKMSKRKRKKGNKSKRGKKGGSGSSSSDDDDDSDCDWNLLVTLQGQNVDKDLVDNVEQNQNITLTASSSPPPQDATQQEPLDTSIPVDNVNDKHEEKSVEQKTLQISEGNNNGDINEINKRRAEFQLDQCEEEEQECIF